MIVMMFSSSGHQRSGVWKLGHLQSLAEVELHEQDERFQAQHVAALVQALDAVCVVQICAGRPKYVGQGGKCKLTGLTSLVAINCQDWLEMARSTFACAGS